MEFTLPSSDLFASLIFAALILVVSSNIPTSRKMGHIDFVIKFAYFDMLSIDMLSMRQIFRQYHFRVSNNPMLHSLRSLV